MGRLALRRYVCASCRTRWREEQTNHDGDIYNIPCPVCDIEKPTGARVWEPTDDPRVINAAGTSGIVPITADPETLPCHVCGVLITREELDENAAYTADGQPHCPAHYPKE